jgi:hypothetical protein
MLRLRCWVRDLVDDHDAHMGESMTLWMFDTSSRELIYLDPQAGPIRFSFDAVCALDPNVKEAELRKVLPRSDASPLVGRNGVRLR